MSQAQPNNHSHLSSSRPTIFVVDDEPMLLELAVVILEHLNYDILTFRDPRTAIDSYSSISPPPALVITDYAMHSMNGLELIAQCRRVNPSQKVLLISGTVDETIYHNSPDKPDRFLAKPYQAKELIDSVYALLGVSAGNYGN
jgi:two-component system, cell cycle sensor histidine kinase and response regulator CckA